MADYIAKYMVNGCLRPRYDFSVDCGDKKSDASAVKIAMEHVRALQTQYRTRNVKLDELLRIEKVEIVELG